MLPRPVVEAMPGIVCSGFARPIARVGLYVPEGIAILQSSALLLGIPAQVAGCRQIVLATPPREDGSILPDALVSIDMPVGHFFCKTPPLRSCAFRPSSSTSSSELKAISIISRIASLGSLGMVIADHTANPTFAAADVLSQAEHGVDSQVVLVAVDSKADHLAAIKREVGEQALALDRVDIIRQSIPKSIIVKVATVEEAVNFSNDYAPEHLILHWEKAKEQMPRIEDACSVFVGAYTPESCGDYASGTNHTLPTNGYARQFSASTRSPSKSTSHPKKLRLPALATWDLWW
ncbi:hypothetical protein NMY22_g17449 [Coprinellus aureogranulatus]|nr:hypothetical protein NMY22_g17449 [Coprinellus aureogranulatus]